MATARAQELINQAAPGDAFSLFVMSEPSRAIIAQPTYEARRALDELQRLKTCTDGGADLASCLELISQTLQDTRDSSPDLKDVHIVFLTDLGRDTWQPAINGAERRRLQELCDQHSVRIESFAQTNTENLAVTSFESESPLVLRSHSTSLSATVSNFSKRAMERVPFSSKPTDERCKPSLSISHPMHSKPLAPNYKRLRLTNGRSAFICPTIDWRSTTNAT